MGAANADPELRARIIATKEIIRILMPEAFIRPILTEFIDLISLPW
jgi:hypothetical protein